jgi:hypothetical protein
MQWLPEDGAGDVQLIPVRMFSTPRAGTMLLAQRLAVFGLLAAEERGANHPTRGHHGRMWQ